MTCTLYQREKNVSVQTPFMCFIQYDYLISREIRIMQALSYQNTISNILDASNLVCLATMPVHSGITTLIVKPDGVAHFGSDVAATLVGHTLGHLDGSDAARLGDDHSGEVGCLKEVVNHKLRQLRRLARPRLPRHQRKHVLSYELHHLIFESEDGQLLPFSKDAFLPLCHIWLFFGL